MHRNITKLTLLVIFLCAIFFSGSANEVNRAVNLKQNINLALGTKHSTTSSFTSYKGLLMAGYQGWFNAPTDGATRGWNHYVKNGLFQPGSCSIDFWPDMTEYPNQYVTSFLYPNGDAATTFSSYDKSTTDLHFKWMKDYGIDGVFMQRFLVTIKNARGLKHSNKILRNAYDAAEFNQRSLAVMYDLSGSSSADMQVLINDWKYLVDSIKITSRGNQQSALYHNGKPLVVIWGVGFTGRNYTTADVDAVVDFLENDPDYGGCAVMLGVPTNWRTLNGDTEANPALHTLIKKVDIVQPWFVGRYTENSYPAFKNSNIKDDITWCKTNNIDYNPTVYPGFSWSNLMTGAAFDQIPRNKGKFLWDQLTGAIEVGAQMIYVAMFDEIDEGTAIFKITNNPPVGASSFVKLEAGLSSDHYLNLSGQAGSLLKLQLGTNGQILKTLSFGSDKTDWTTSGASTVSVVTTNPAAAKTYSYLQVNNKDNSSPLMFLYKRTLGGFDTKITNLATGHFRFWLYVDDVSKLNLTGGSIEISSSLNNDFNEYTWPFPVTSLVNGWNDIDLSFANAGITQAPSGQTGGGLPNLANIVRFRIFSSSSATISVRIDELRFYDTTTLPINLVSFKVQKNLNTVNIKWQTISETNSDYFEIEKSVDGKNFNTLAKLNAQGESNELNNYSLVDFNPTSGNNYYRLLQYDKDGRKTNYGVRVVKFGIDNEGVVFQVYPNPSSELVNFSLKGYSGDNFKIELYDLSGKKIVEKLINTATDKDLFINLKEQPQITTGQYILRAIGKNLNESKQITVK